MSVNFSLTAGNFSGARSVNNSTPTLSVVVTLVSGRTQDLAACLKSLHDQEDSPAIEILVPYDDPCRDVTRLGSNLPQCALLAHRRGLDFTAARAAASHEPYDILRTVGVKAARGCYTALTEDHSTLAPRWCRTAIELLEEHPDLGAVGAQIECGSDRLLNRAIYYCDYGRYQNPLPEGPAVFVSDSNVVYRSQALDDIRSVWENGFSEFPVHQALVERGRPIWLSPRITACQNRVEMTLGEAIKERYVWGRTFAAVRFDGRLMIRRLMYAGLSPAVPVLLMLRLVRRAFSDGRRPGRFLPALPHIALLTSVWASGEFVGYLIGGPNSKEPAHNFAAGE